MQRRKSAYFRNALDLKDRVQVRIIRRRLKLSTGELDGIVRKAGNSITAINKEATTTRAK
jgi:Holliday junction resolvase-like predicted endonuclease